MYEISIVAIMNERIYYLKVEKNIFFIKTMIKDMH